MSRRAWLKVTLPLLIASLALLSLLVIAVDPFQIYRLSTHFLPPIDNTTQVYSNAGIVRNYAYDSAIVGTSVTENFRPSYLEERLGGRAARLRRSVLRLRGGADADDARYHQDARDVLGSGYDPGPGQLRCLGKQSAFGRAAHLRAGRHRDQPNRAGGAEALVGQVRLGHDGRQDGSDDSFVRLPPGRHSVLPAVRLIGTKGSDPSVYVLLYMLDGGAG